MSEQPKHNQQRSRDKNRASKKFRGSASSIFKKGDKKNNRIEESGKAPDDKYEENNTSPKVGQFINENKGKDAWDKAGVIINALIALGTFAAIFFTWKSVRISNKANETAAHSLYVSQQALKDSRKKDSIDRIIQTSKDSLQSILDSINIYRDGIRLDITKQSLQQQINSISNERDLFKIENRGYIGITDLVFDTTFKIVPSNISCVVNNKGKLPIKIYKREMGSIGWGGIPHKATASMVKKTMADSNLLVTTYTNDFLPNETYIVMSKVSPKYYGDTFVHLFEKGFAYLIVYIELHYECIGIGKKYRHVTAIRIKRGANPPQPYNMELNFETFEISDTEIFE